MKARSIILYAHNRRLGEWGETECKTSLKAFPDIVIRVEVVEGDDLEALAQAKPQPGETVLNTLTVDLQGKIV